MNILQVLPELNAGGVETGTVDFAKYLGRHGHGSVVVSNGGYLVRELQEGGCTHYALPVHQKNIFIAFG
ncbi:MAG TPA: glycosyl transferase, partial [Candidatus Omnitrophota bacterium]|nr:glycosyl transferase [Candidatus Omnitrophota bacterium]